MAESLKWKWDTLAADDISRMSTAVILQCFHFLMWNQREREKDRQRERERKREKFLPLYTRQVSPQHQFKQMTHSTFMSTICHKGCHKKVVRCMRHCTPFMTSWCHDGPNSYGCSAEFVRGLCVAVLSLQFTYPSLCITSERWTINLILHECTGRFITRAVLLHFHNHM